MMFLSGPASKSQAGCFASLRQLSNLSSNTMHQDYCLPSAGLSPGPSRAAATASYPAVTLAEVECLISSPVTAEQMTQVPPSNFTANPTLIVTFPYLGKTDSKTA